MLCQWRQLALPIFAAAVAVAGERKILWEDRGRATLEAQGTPPAAPFRFISEDRSGRSPKLMLRDANGAEWAVKFGPEVKAETFATRLAWALGYYSDATWFIAEGTVTGARDLDRAGRHIDKQGRFREARFEYRDKSCRFRTDANWSWTYNPFLGSRDLQGLRILAMLVSNWDHKDARDEDSNTAIVECGSGADRRLIYYISDWGGSMGKWGRKFRHNKWDCEGFAAQTPEFIKSVEDGQVRFGFASGRGSGDLRDNISVEDIRWFLARLQPISQADLREALLASGASEHEAQHFSDALWARITALREVAEPQSAAATEQ